MGFCVALTASGCSFTGLNSLPLPGAVGRGPDAAVYHLEVANVGTLESNSPVMIDNVVVGSVGTMRFDDWHADVEVSVRPDVVVPANAVATVGQTSLLGSMHIALDPPVDEPPKGVRRPGSTIPLAATSSYPSTEQTLASLSTLVNGGGLGQIGEIVRSLNSALSGNEPQVRELLERLDRFVGVFDSQRGEVIEAMKALDRLSGTLVAQQEVLSAALRDIPPALDVLIAQRPNFTTALERLGAFGDTATALVNESGADLVANLKNLDPTLKSLADVGPDLSRVLGYLPTAPFNQNIIDRGVRGDYMNLFIILDFTTARLKRTLLAGTRWEDQYAQLVPAPGDIGYDAYYSRNPLGAPISPPPATYEDSLRIVPPPPAGGGR
ncbi:MCE family protein [Mycobacterium sp. IS-3022]|uniref:MCE family protein n=1 Tax=Mycobacterium sp. IS-3022 TaxID=1772277 RepID=UPI0012E3DEFF|nr:MCE family protein [Mycobacterium sp. IS-3022]